MDDLLTAAGQAGILSDSILGTSYQNTTINPAQNQAVWSGQQQAIYPGVLTAKQAEVRTSSYPDVNLRVIKAQNGYIVMVGGEHHIATTLEDVSTIVISTLASRMLEND